MQSSVAHHPTLAAPVFRRSTKVGSHELSLAAPALFPRWPPPLAVLNCLRQWSGAPPNACLKADEKFQPHDVRLCQSNGSIDDRVEPGPTVAFLPVGHSIVAIHDGQVSSVIVEAYHPFNAQRLRVQAEQADLLVIRYAGKPFGAHRDFFGLRFNPVPTQQISAAIAGEESRPANIPVSPVC